MFHTYFVDVVITSFTDLNAVVHDLLEKESHISSFKLSFVVTKMTVTNINIKDEMKVL
jgi:hypothetical protein